MDNDKKDSLLYNTCDCKGNQPSVNENGTIFWVVRGFNHGTNRPNPITEFNIIYENGGYKLQLMEYMHCV